MRKKILATLMIVGLLAAQTLTVCAAGSAVTGVTVSSGYTVAIDAKNGEEKNLTEMVKNSPEEVKKAVEGKTALTPVMDVKADGAQKDANGKYVVTFNVQNLTSSVKNVTVLHFNGTAWEVVESSFDAAAKTVTAKFASLSPVVIVADTGSSNGGNGGSSSGSSSSSSSSSSAAASPKTGAASDWMMWIGAAVVLGAASVALKKKEA